jgi:outer membrane protein TolC
MHQYFQLLSIVASTAIVFYATPAVLAQHSPSPVTTPSTSGTIPDRLNPDPNLLLRPQTPSDVQIQATYSITFQQALALALRNNPQLQIERETLARSQASLRERKAALYPTLSLQSDFTRQETYDLSTDDSSSTELDQLGISSSTDSSSASSTLSGDVQLSYNIYTGGERAANIVPEVDGVNN